MVSMINSDRLPVAVLGLGEMGRVLADALIDAGHPVTIWNRTSGREVELVARGAVSAATVADAVTAADVVVVCLLDHSSVRQTLEPVAERLRERTVINLTTTTPDEARATARWAQQHRIDYLDGAIMAVPSMIGTSAARILYSGSHAVYDEHRALLDRWGTGEFRGEDAGLAALLDLAMLSGMYHLFAGFFHGAAMTGSASISATEFAERQVPFLAAMLDSLHHFAEIVDSGDYTVPGQQSLSFSDHTDLIRASEDQGVDPGTLVAIQKLITRQLDTGHGAEGYARIYESFRRAP